MLFNKLKYRHALYLLKINNPPSDGSPSIKDYLPPIWDGKGVQH